MSDSFSSYGFDERVLSKIAEMGWESPTAIQESMFNYVLNKRNVIAKARTGSGKTAAYVLPLLDLNLKNPNHKSIIFVPSRELLQQVYRMVKHLAPKDCYVFELSDNISEQTFQNLQPDIIITTPSKLMKNINLIQNFLSLYKSIVIDEADLVTTFGHSNALKKLVALEELKNVQLILLSATLDIEDEELNELRSILNINEPIILSLKSLPSNDRLKQFNVSCHEAEDKFLLLLALLKLKLLTGKSLIFCNDVDNCYRVRLFLEQFGLKSVVLNAEMPYKSRLHTADTDKMHSTSSTSTSDSFNFIIIAKSLPVTTKAMSNTYLKFLINGEKMYTSDIIKESNTPHYDPFSILKTEFGKFPKMIELTVEIWNQRIDKHRDDYLGSAEFKILKCLDGYYDVKLESDDGGRVGLLSISCLE